VINADHSRSAILRKTALLQFLKPKQFRMKNIKIGFQLVFINSFEKGEKQKMEALWCLTPLLFPVAFLVIGGSIMMSIAWLIGRSKQKQVVVTIKSRESRIANKNTVNLFSCKTESGETVVLHNSPSVYGWKMIKQTMAINARLEDGKKYRLLVAGPDWFYGQNILSVVEKIE
jgi:hypothetical protein